MARKLRRQRSDGLWVPVSRTSGGLVRPAGSGCSSQCCGGDWCCGRNYDWSVESVTAEAWERVEWIDAVDTDFWVEYERSLELHSETTCPGSGLSKCYDASLHWSQTSNREWLNLGSGTEPMTVWTSDAIAGDWFQCIGFANLTRFSGGFVTQFHGSFPHLLGLGLWSTFRPDFQATHSGGYPCTSCAACYFAGGGTCLVDVTDFSNMGTSFDNFSATFPDAAATTRTAAWTAAGATLSADVEIDIDETNVAWTDVDEPWEPPIVIPYYRRELQATLSYTLARHATAESCLAQRLLPSGTCGSCEAEAVMMNNLLRSDPRRLL